MNFSRVLSRFRYCFSFNFVTALRSLLFAVVAAELSLSPAIGLPLHHHAKAKSEETATLVEAAEYLPCASGCSTHAAPASAFCFRIGDRVQVAEGKSYLHEGKFSGLEDLAGKQLAVRVNQRSLWVTPPDGRTVKLELGSRYESFKDSSCVREVHRPILDAAAAHKRPAKVPPDALALAGSGKNDLFLWFQCDLNSSEATISCRRWYGNGEPTTKDWFCARTLEGAPVAANFEIDPLLSQDGRLVLRSGAVLAHDGRARTEDRLDRPGEVCR
jgi:hypothetical protein